MHRIFISSGQNEIAAGGFILGTPADPGTKSGLSRDQVLRPLLDAHLWEMTVPEKPTCRLQKYRLTKNGQATLARMQKGKQP